MFAICRAAAVPISRWPGGQVVLELSTGRQDGGEGGGGREEGGGEDGGRLDLRAGGARHPGTRGGLAADL